MRQDVKLGFAIGGVLLAVLIVYVLVVPGGSNQKKLAANGNGAITSQDGGISLEPVKKDGKTAGAAPAATTPPASPAGASPLAEKDAGKVDPFKNEEPEPQPRADAKNKNLDWNKLLNETPTMIGQTPQGKSVAGTGATSGAGSEIATGTGVSTNELAPTIPAVPPVTAGAGTPPIDAAPEAPTVPEAAGPTPTTPAVAGPTVESATASKHTVKEGETYSSIAIASYGSSNFYPALMRANPSVDPQRLKPGMTINVPPISQVKPNEAAAVPAAAKIAPIIDPTKEYRVQPGDSLHKISTRLYGNIGKADKIYQLNKQAIGEDPHRLKVGQVLQLPEPPAAKPAAR